MLCTEGKGGGKEGAGRQRREGAGEGSGRLRLPTGGMGLSAVGAAHSCGTGVERVTMTGKRVYLGVVAGRG